MKATGYRLLPLKALLVLVLLAAGILLVLWPSFRHAVALQESARSHRLQQLQLTFDNFIQQRRNDLEMLAYSPALKIYLERNSDIHADMAAQSFRALSALHDVYDQVRFIDTLGQEQIRANREYGYSYLLNKDALQNKAQRYYVKAGLKLEPGQAFLSELDLNIEHDQIEQPYKPSLRFVVPVMNAGERQGMVVLNIHADTLLESLRQVLPAGHELALFNERGDWLSGGGAKDWQFMFGTESGLAHDVPDRWAEIQKQEQGHFTFENSCYNYRWHRPQGRQLLAPSWLLAERTPDLPCDALFQKYRSVGLNLLFFSALVTLPLLLFWFHWRRRYLHARQQIEMSEQQLRLITNQVGQALIVVDRNGNLSWMNPEAERVLGWSEDELRGRNLHRLVHVTSDGKVLHEGECPTMSTLRTGLRHHSEQSLFRTRQSEILTVRLTVTPYGNALEQGAVLAFSDNSQNTERERRLRQQASTDELTGVLNRRAVLALMQTLLEEDKGCVGVMLLDIDLFKQVNDNYGHAAGDQVLIHFCRTVSRLVRREDLFGRIGGEEFLLVLAETERTALLQLAERVREAVAASPCLMDEIEIPVTVSIGVAMQQGETEVDTLVARADHALYEAKRTGRNRVEWSQP